MRTLPFIVFLFSLGAIFYITGNKVNQYGASDPLLTLPTSQALIQTGHTYLTHLEDQTITPDGRPLSAVVGNYQAAEINGEIVDVYSPGPALITIPLTAVLTRAGYDLNDPSTNMAVQNRLAFLTSSLVLIGLYFICRVRLEIIPSLTISHVTFFGSSIFANMGLAYFNLNIALLFTCWALLLLAILERKGLVDGPTDSALIRFFANSTPAIVGTSIGLCLFLAFTGRPSAAILIVITFGYLLLHHRTVAYFAMGSALAFLIVFSLWSQAEYGELLPIYFNPEKSNDAPLPIWIGVLGNLVSPSRGMLVFMPWLMLVPAMILWQRRVITSKLTVWIGIWFALLLVTVSRSVIWWGGASFGPRLMAEVVPGLVLLGVFGWANINEKQNAKHDYWRPILIGFFLVSGTFSIWVNSYQPFFNTFTGGAWQDNITGFPLDSGDSLGPFFKWENRQWAADAEQVCQQNAEMIEKVYLKDQQQFNRLQPGEPINHLSDNGLTLDSTAQARASNRLTELTKTPAILEGFLLPQGDSSWTMCRDAAVYFIPATALIESQRIELTLSGRALNNQPINLLINGKPLAPLSVAARPDGPAETITIQFQSDLLNPDKINAIAFEFSESKIVSLPDFSPTIEGKFGYQLTALMLDIAE
ncbi:MAG: hypothetical protein AB8G95_22220 [Anaerolineae bacterium]